MADSRFGWISGIAGMLTAAVVFVVLHAWTPPRFLLEALDAGPTREPVPLEPRYHLAVRPDPRTGPEVLATDADIVAARPAHADNQQAAALELTAAARARVAAYAKDHPDGGLAIVVDDAVIASRPARDLAGPILTVPAGRPLAETSGEVAAHFGGAPVPPPWWALTAGRLVPALVAGFVVLALLRILTGR